MFRKLILGVAATSGMVANLGCINQYMGNKNTRMEQLLYQSEDLRQMGKEWRRFWFNDQPSHMSTERVHGGIID